MCPRLQTKSKQTCNGSIQGLHRELPSVYFIPFSSPPVPSFRRFFSTSTSNLTGPTSMCKVPSMDIIPESRATAVYGVPKSSYVHKRMKAFRVFCYVHNDLNILIGLTSTAPFLVIGSLPFLHFSYDYQ